MNITPLTKEKEPLWNKFVESHPATNFYQLLGWKSVFESTFGYAPRYYIALNSKDEVAGILPMFRMRDIFWRRYLVANPFSNFAGICAESGEVEESLVEKAAEIARSEAAQYVEFRQLRQPLRRDLPTKESFVTLMLELSRDPDVHWQHISSRNRNKIRKAEKNGLTVDFGLHYLKDFHEIYSINLRLLGTPIFPYRMFEKVIAVFKDQVELLVLKLDGQVVSGMFLFKFKNMISEPWVASLRQYNKIYINNYLYWQAIKYACENGFDVFDFGRSTADTGTYSFKMQWGAEPVQLYYQYYLNKASTVPVVDANNNKYQRIIDVWKKLPLFVTNFIGPRVVQYLPEL
ncbi:MAG: FemAB family PEP-CTERM system-associated protein [Calditrichaeota bacterium]|nr:FemAB family PEP-CTERM system-associated protein [Calditrichota bacterium]